jgi:O-antigen ligase
MAFINLVLSVALFAVLTSWLKANPAKHAMVWFCLGAAMMAYSIVPQLGFTIMSGTFPGHTDGFEVTLLDVVGLSYIASKAGDKRPYNIPFRSVMIAYFLVVTLAVPFAYYYKASLFYVFQLLRIYLFYKAVFIGSMDKKNFTAFLKGLAFGMTAEMFIVFYQRFGTGDIQPDGTFGHQNLLGFACNAVLGVSIVSILLGDRPTSRWVSAGGALMTAAVTGSRGVVAFAFTLLATTYLQSLFHGSSSRKIKIGVAGVVAASILLPVAIIQLQMRFENEKIVFGNEQGEFKDYDERAAYIKAAQAMVSDNPFGIGPNNFVVVANVDGYYERARVLPTSGSRGGHVHNIYYLTLGEIGYPGLIALVCLFAVPVWKGFGVARKHRGSKDAEMAGGLATALAICYAHSWVEWIIVTSSAQYFVAMLLGLLASRLVILESAGVFAKAAAGPERVSQGFAPPLMPQPAAKTALDPPPPSVKRHYPKRGVRPPDPSRPKPQF